MRYDLMAVPGVLVVMWALCLGCGLAVERVLRLRLGNALVLPLGLCVAFVLIMPGYAAGAGDALAIALLVGVAIAGFVFAQDGPRARLNPGWPGAAGLAAYVLFMLPVIAHGHWTWSGYDFVNDSGFEMLLASHIQGFGTMLGNIPETSEREFLNSYLNNGYPLGTQALLGTIGGLTDTPVAVLYQGFIGGLVAAGAIALSTVTRGLLSARRAAIVGFLAISASLTYQYALQGAIKEIGLLAALCATLALGREAISQSRPYAASALVAVGAAAALATYSAVAVPFIGALVVFIGLGIVLARRGRPRVGWAGPLAIGALVAAVLSVPALLTFGTFFNVAQTGQGSTGLGAIQFGQLLRALPLQQISGIWLAGEYRLAIVPQPAAHLTKLAALVIFAMVIVSLAWSLRRRDAGLPMAAGMIGLVLLIVFPRVSPYAQGKLLAISSPFVLLIALSGLFGMRGRLSIITFGVAGLLGIGILASDLLAYGYDRVAPTQRIEAIQATGDHFAGRGPVLWNEFEEYAKVFARAAKISSPFEALTPQQVQLRSPTYFYGHYFDLDQELFSFVEKYPIIVTRRSPAASRPPANYRLVYQNQYYLGWRRTSTPQVLRHLPLQQLYSPSATVTCAALKPIAANAPAGSRLVAAVAPELATFTPTSDPTRSGGWGVDPDQAGAVVTSTAGHAKGTVKVRGGRYTVWVQGDFPRAIHVIVDGRKVGSVSGSNTPLQWLPAGSVYLKPGAHLVVLEKSPGRRHFGPGEWGIGLIGALALQGQEPERLLSVAPADRRKLCGIEADWVELVRP